MLLRSIAALMALVFAGFAAVQYNDPDGILWAVAYAIPSMVSVAVCFDRIPRALPAIAAPYAVWALWLSPQLLQRAWIHSEEARESAGLFIAALWLFSLFLIERRRARR